MKVFTLEFWDGFLSKIFTSLVSVKVWVISMLVYLIFHLVDHFTSLLLSQKIDPETYGNLISAVMTGWASAIGVILGVRGAIEIASVIQEKKVLPKPESEDEEA